MYVRARAMGRVRDEEKLVPAAHNYTFQNVIVPTTITQEHTLLGYSEAYLGLAFEPLA